MRRIAAVVVVLLVLTGAFLLVNPFFAPTLEEAESSVAVTQNKTAYLIQNTPDSSYIYGVDQSNTVMSSARLKHDDGGLTKVTMLTASKGTVYALRETVRAESGKPAAGRCSALVRTKKAFLLFVRECMTA